jgi:molybdate-binding protein
MSSDCQYDVFLSHTQAEKPQVRRLAERLRDAGLRAWFEEWVIQPGDDVCLAIERGLEWCTLVPWPLADQGYSFLSSRLDRHGAVREVVELA